MQEAEAGAKSTAQALMDKIREAKARLELKLVRDIKVSKVKRDTYRNNMGLQVDGRDNTVTVNTEKAEVISTSFCTSCHMWIVLPGFWTYQHRLRREGHWRSSSERPLRQLVCIQTHGVRLWSLESVNIAGQCHCKVTVYHLQKTMASRRGPWWLQEG